MDILTALLTTKSHVIGDLLICIGGFLHMNRLKKDIQEMIHADIAEIKKDLREVREYVFNKLK